MRGLEPFDDAADGTVFRDVIMLALLGFVAIVVLLLPQPWLRYRSRNLPQ